MTEPAKLRRFDVMYSFGVGRVRNYEDTGECYDADEVDAALAQRDAEIAHLRGSESLLSKTVTSLQEQVDERDAEIERLREIVEAACAEARALVGDPNIRVEPDNLAECIDKRRREFESGRKRMHAEIERLRKALAFAACCIKSGEPWTETCEAEIGGALRGAKEADPR